MKHINIFIIILMFTVALKLERNKFKHRLKQCDVIYINLYEVTSCDTICLTRVDVSQQVCFIGNRLSIINNDTCLLDSLECISKTDDILLEYFYKKHIIYASGEYGYIVALGLEIFDESSMMIKRHNTIVKVSSCNEEGSIHKYCYSYKEFLLDNIWYFDSVELCRDTLELKCFKRSNAYLNILFVRGPWALAVLDTLQFSDSTANKYWIKWYNGVQRRLTGEPVLQF